MASLLPGGFQLPFQRRLSRLYNDTKKSSDFVKEPFQNEHDDPEAKALHRKLRIQKDRLVSWGLEWSDPNNQAAEIDESLSKAGLSEVVGSIMSTIKDILAEAEPLWLSSKRVIEGTKASPDSKPPLIQWDKNRFEDLVNDLTASIDTLYDLSRTRASGLMPRRASKTPYKGAGSEDFRPFESTRMQTPQQIDPGTLTHLKSSDGNVSPLREVVFMSKTAYSELAHGRTREPWGPLLLEYATFDSIYSTTGIMPPMARFEKLCAGLQQDSQRAPGAWTGLPRLLGYFEDIENSRIGLVYRFPSLFNAVSIEPLSQSAMYSLPTLRDLLARSDSEPQLEAKFRLAHNLTNTVFDMHARGVTHGHLFDQNISFCHVAKENIVDVRRPLVSSFDLFPGDETAGSNIWRHPLYPKSANSAVVKNTDARVLELYPLAILLLSVGLWVNPEGLLEGSATHVSQQNALQKLAVACGSLYSKAVQACWDAVDDEASGRITGESLLSEVQVKVSRFLEACCILDGVSGLEHRLHEDLQSPAQAGPEGEGSRVKMESKYTPTDITQQREPEPDTELEPLTRPVSRPETSKLKLYPNVPLAPEAVEKWNSILMPQINQALRAFYRKHPESVEISLESVGPDAQTTQPTVLVVCTSVGKVRAILKKRLGDIFDGSTGFGLKVCRGQVLRSRKHSQPTYRSMDKDDNGKGAAHHDEEIEAVNPEFQERPWNGASIGAWIGDRHLPPVSFGGLVVVDDKTYGMTVHHMLDDPDRDFSRQDAKRSSAFTATLPSMDFYDEFDEDSNDDGDGGFELDDSEDDEYSETDITSDYDDSDDEYDNEEYEEPGDIPGIEPGCGEGYIVTQPALDDVEDGFYPCAETEDDDHLDTFSLGEVYASSGIRRKEVNGLIHEVDWALFQFAEGRIPEDNSVFKAEEGVSTRRNRHRTSCQKPIRPTTVAPSTSLPGMQVQCVARTSGVQTGQILPALCSVKIYGRMSPSQTYQVASGPATAGEGELKKGAIPMGIPGDSGAWVVERKHGQLCGHILAWSQRKRVAYICPMDVLLMDIAETLEANEVKLPGGEAVITGEEDEVTKELEGMDLSGLVGVPATKSSLLANLRMDRLQMDEGLVSV